MLQARVQSESEAWSSTQGLSDAAPIVQHRKDGRVESFAIDSNALIFELIQNHRGNNRNQHQAATGGAFIDVGNFAPH